MLLLYGYQTGVKQQAVQLALLAKQGIGVGCMQVKRQRAAVELMAVLEIAAYLVAVAAGVFRIGVVANRPVGEVADMLLQLVLRIHHYGQVYDGSRRQQVEQGIDAVAARGFSGQQAGRRRFAQAVDHHHFMRSVIQPPNAVLCVRARFARQQSFSEIGDNGQRFSFR